MNGLLTRTPSSTDVLLAGLTVSGVALATVAVGVFAKRAGFTRPWRLAGVVGAVLTAWLAATAALAASGLLADPASRPPRVPLLAVAGVATLVLVALTGLARRLLPVIPLWLPVALQVFRVVVEYTFWRSWQDGRAPVQVTFEGWNFDILAGLTAPLVAVGTAVGRVGPRAAIAWNLCGLAMLSTAVYSVVTSAPGPFRLDWPGDPFTAVATWPLVWVPALLAPAAVCLHVVSIRQCLLHLGNAARSRTVG